MTNDEPQPKTTITEESRSALIKTRNALRIITGIWSFFFLITSIGTAIAFASTSDFLAHATHVEGRVIALYRSSKGAQIPAVRFTTSTGEVLDLKSDLGTSPAPELGASVKVAYRTSNPRDWRIEDWIHLYFWTFLCSIGMGTSLCVVTVTKLIGDRKIRKLQRTS